MPGTKKLEQKNTAGKERAPECNDVPCVLDSPVRPRFFRGQLLTHEDLMAQQQWVQTKLRLDRLLFGWGVVCGLEVTKRAVEESEELNADQESPSSEVTIRPGYALDFTGEDIVVPQEVSFDVSQDCVKPTALCEALPSSSAPKPGVICKVQLCVQYAEKQMSPQPVLGNGEQVPAACKPSRILETFRLTTRTLIGYVFSMKSELAEELTYSAASVPVHERVRTIFHGHGHALTSEAQVHWDAQKYLWRIADGDSHYRLQTSQPKGDGTEIYVYRLDADSPVSDDCGVPLAAINMVVTKKLLYDITLVEMTPPFRCMLRCAKTASETVDRSEAWEEQAERQAPVMGTAATVLSLDNPPKDDLTKVAGVGKKSAEAFRTAGIYTFAALADLTLDRIEEILRSAGVLIMQINPTRTREDARRLAKEATEP